MREPEDFSVETVALALSGISGSDPRQSIVIRVQTEEPNGAK